MIDDMFKLTIDIIYNPQNNLNHNLTQYYPKQAIQDLICPVSNHEVADYENNEILWEILGNFNEN